LHVKTVQHENFVFQCSEALDAVELIDYMLLNLRQRSSYGVVIEGTQTEDQIENHLILSPGDLVQFEAGVTVAQLMAGDSKCLWRGTVSGQTSEFAAGNVRILATLSRPNLALQQVLKERSAGVSLDSAPKAIEKPIPPRRRQHTLAQFAELQFRESLE